jgi:hypothetical protein
MPVSSYPGPTDRTSSLPAADSRAAAAGQCASVDPSVKPVAPKYVYLREARSVS